MKVEAETKSLISGDFVFILIILATAICTVFSGGMMWQNCIIPILMLGLACTFALKKINPYTGFVSLLLLVLSFCSAFFSKGNVQTGIYESEKFLFFILALLIGSVKHRDKNIRYVIYTAGILTAFTGLFAYSGIIPLKDFVINDGGIIRLQSSVKYANTAACILATGYFTFLDFYSEKKRSIHKFFGAAMLIALYLTFSKATIALFVAVGALYIFKRRDTADIFVHQNIFALIFLLPVMYTAKHHLYFITFLLIALTVFISGRWCVIKDNELCVKLWLMLTFLGVVGAILLLFIKPGFFATFTQRLVYMKDALDIVLKYPFLGSGMGSWRVLQFSVQSAPYNIPYIHNGFLQYLTEGGILFGALFAAVIIKALLGAVKAGEISLFCTLLIISLHSLVDFDLSFPVVLIITGLLAGHFLFSTSKSTAKIPSMLLIIPAFFISVYMTAEYSIRYSFEKHCIEENYEKATSKLNLLTVLCPKDSTIPINHAAIEEKTDNNTEKIKACIDNARRLSPYDPEIYESYIKYNMTADNIEELLNAYINMKERHESTYVTVKELINTAVSEGMIDENEKQRLVEVFDEIRFNNKVYDRDELLDRLMKNKTEA